MYVDGISVGEVGDVVLRDRRALAKDGMFLVVVTVDSRPAISWARRRSSRGASSAGMDDALHQGRAPAHRAIDRRRPGDHLSEIGLLKVADQGRALPIPLRADASTPDGLPGHRGGVGMATARRSKPTSRSSSSKSKSSTSSRSRAASKTARTPLVSPDVLRSLLGVILLVLGAITVIALFLPEAGLLKGYVDELRAAAVRPGRLAARRAPPRRRRARRAAAVGRPRLGHGHPRRPHRLHRR